ncbi:unnamed protein product [Microthlaspi erraticum]|uniref:RNase H type-1 domain-containing protein n=1 Tax=Microthlaspi erraticum TaxID=1685480 RepID=A0A6D2JAG5_9BRAS|nr:unnamed protein product [Microthlaspi erraticum]
METDGAVDGGGFSLNIGCCTARMAELWGVYYGLWPLHCLGKGILRVEVEIDSLMVVGFLKSVICDTYPLSFLVHMCHDLLSKDWKV